MYELEIPDRELFDEKTNSFTYIKGTTLRLEHSLVSVAKWESKWKIPFMRKDPPKTLEQSRDYIRCMTISQNVDPNIYLAINSKEMNAINNYIDDPQTATWFTEDKKPKTKAPSKEIVTAELIYYWMFSYNIPKECEKWHLNRLITLCRVFMVKEQKPKKMSRKEQMEQYRALNAARKAKHHTKG